MKQFALALGISAMLLAGNAAAKEYYKWSDDNGVTHFTPAPPTDRPSEVVNTYAGSSTVYDPSAANAATTEAKTEKNQLEKTKEEEKKTASQKDEKCKKVAEQIKTLTERGRVEIVDKEGNTRVLTPDEQKQKIQEYKTYIDASCSGKTDDKKEDAKTDTK